MTWGSRFATEVQRTWLNPQVQPPKSPTLRVDGQLLHAAAGHKVDTKIVPPSRRQAVRDIHVKVT